MNVGFYLLSNAYESKTKAQSENMDFLGQEREREPRTTVISWLTGD